MKLTIITLLFFGFSFNLFAQEYERPEAEESKSRKELNSITIGFLQGGGSLVGVDFEALITKSMGLQLGGGFVGYGAGINYHFKPTIRSTFFSFQYWHQGIGDSYVQSVVGPNIVFRAKRFFTAQIGAGVPFALGPAYPAGQKQPSFIAMYAIGAYFPLRNH